MLWRCLDGAASRAAHPTSFKDVRLVRGMVFLKTEVDELHLHPMLDISPFLATSTPHALSTRSTRGCAFAFDLS